jgi:hypothetical protein
MQLDSRGLVVGKVAMTVTIRHGPKGKTDGANPC